MGQKVNVAVRRFRTVEEEKKALKAWMESEAMQVLGVKDSRLLAILVDRMGESMERLFDAGMECALDKLEGA